MAQGGIDGSKLARKIASLAFGRANDAVKLAFLTPEETERIDGLDLRMVSEVKRSDKGAVEVKLLSRLALMELLAGLVGAAAGESDRAESFFRAMDAAAEALGDDEA